MVAYSFQGLMELVHQLTEDVHILFVFLKAQKSCFPPQWERNTEDKCSASQ